MSSIKTEVIHNTLCVYIYTYHYFLKNNISIAFFHHYTLRKKFEFMIKNLFLKYMEYHRSSKTSWPKLLMESKNKRHLCSAKNKAHVCVCIHSLSDIRTQNLHMQISLSLSLHTLSSFHTSIYAMRFHMLKPYSSKSNIISFSNADDPS